jgi:hypothetical protein
MKEQRITKSSKETKRPKKTIRAPTGKIKVKET